MYRESRTLIEIAGVAGRGSVRTTPSPCLEEKAFYGGAIGRLRFLCKRQIQILKIQEKGGKISEKVSLVKGVTIDGVVPPSRSGDLRNVADSCAEEKGSCEKAERLRPGRDESS